MTWVASSTDGRHVQHSVILFCARLTCDFYASVIEQRGNLAWVPTAASPLRTASKTEKGLAYLELASFFAFATFPELVYDVPARRPAGAGNKLCYRRGRERLRRRR